MSSLMVCREVTPLWYVWEALVCVEVHATESIMEQIEQQLLLLWRISNDKK